MKRATSGCNNRVSFVRDNFIYLNHIRLYNLDFRTRDQAFVLEASTSSLSMSVLVEDEADQKFAILEVDDESPTVCPAPLATDIQGTSIIRGGPRTCGRRFVWAFGRCERVYT